ncbi:LysR family transcriptional regulator [Psychromonas aquimarina]|uniref:LysR family transcriptional regulator n=1 Tax=Psychromonas aquimarina TaxID=444919 RepID=UPI0004294E95|nr:LysR family transcriptional regulator [Psychromonas aquimarina]
MNIQHLKAFVLANQLGSISAAAKSMGKRQSQVSQWIANLEIDLGAALFERTGNSTHLSEQGQTLLPMIVHTLSQAEKLSACAQALCSNEPVTLRLGIDNFIPPSSLHRALVSALTELPVNIEVSSDERRVLTEQLQDKSLDIALLSEGEALHYNDYEYCRLGCYRDILVVGRGHVLSQQAAVTTEMLSEFRELIWTREEITEDNEPGYSSCYGTFSDLSTLLAVLKSGIGYAFLPQDMIKTELDGQELSLLQTDFEQKQITRRVELLWQPGLQQTRQGTKLLNIIKKQHEFMC